MHFSYSDKCVFVFMFVSFSVFLSHTYLLIFCCAFSNYPLLFYSFSELVLFFTSSCSTLIQLRYWNQTTISWFIVWVCRSGPPLAAASSLRTPRNWSFLRSTERLVLFLIQECSCGWIISILKWTFVNEISFLTIKEALQHLLVADRVFNSLLLLCLFDLTKVADSADLCLYFINSLYMPVTV